VTWSKDEKSGRARRARDRGAQRRVDRSGETDGGSAWESSKQKADTRRKRQRLGRIALVVAVAVLLVVALLPTAASWLAPGIIASSASGAIAGRVEVGSVSLGWLGSQRVSSLRVYDDRGEQRAEIDAVADKGLLALVFAGGDYGTVRLSGHADLSPDESGRGFMEHTVGVAPAEAAEPGETPAPRAPEPPAPPPTLPPGLRATLALDNLRLTYADPRLSDAIDALRIDNATGSVALDTGGTTVVRLGAGLGARRAGETVFADSGRVEISARLSNLTDASGVVRPETAAVEADMTVDGLASSLLDLVAGLEGAGGPALGPGIGATISANGTGADLAVTAHAAAESLEAHAALRVSLTDARITADGPITARLDLDRLSALIPDRDALLGPGADVHVTAYPEVNVEVTGLSFPIPEGGAIDLRGAGAAVTVAIGELAARVNEPTTGQTRDVALLPGTLTLDATDLGGPVRFATDLRTRVDGADAGTLTADLTADGLLDDSGAPAAGTTPRLRGSVRAEQLALAAAQPIAMATAGIDLLALLGETADLELTARPLQGDAAGGDPAATALVIKGGSPHASIDGRLALANGTVTSDGLVASLDRLDPLLAERLAPAGVTLTEASGAELRLRNLSVALDRLAEGDLSAVRAAVTTKLTRFAATIDETGETIETTVLNAEAVADPLGGGVRVTSNARLRMNDRLAGALAADLTASGVLDDTGAVRPGLPGRIGGSITATQVRTAAIQPFVGSGALRLPQDIGPTIDVTLSASTSTDSSPADAGSIPPTDLALDVTSEKLNGRGTFRLTGDRVSATGDGLVLTLAQVGSILERSGSLGETVRLNKPGWLRLAVERLDLPLGDDGAPLPEQAAASAELRVAGVVVASGDETASFDNLVAGVTLAPGDAPVLTLDGATTSGDKKGTIKGRIELRNAFKPAAEDGTLLVRPIGAVTLEGIPTSIAGLAGVTFPVDGGGTLALADLATAATGANLDLTLGFSEAESGGLAVSTELGSARTTLTAGATVDPGAGGAMDLVDINAEGSIRLTQYLARTLARAFAPRQYHAVTLPEPGEIVLTAETDGNGVVAARAGLARTTVAGLPVPNGEGGFQTLEPISLVGRIDAEMPLAVLRGDPAPQGVTLQALLDGFAADDPDNRALTVRADASTTLVEMLPSGKTSANVRVATQRTAWLDALAGLDGLLNEAVGQNVRLDASLEASAAADGSMGDGTASIEIRSPLLKTAAPIELALSTDTLRLTRPAEIGWTLTRRLMDALAPVQDDAVGQLTIARDVPLTLRADQLELPLGGVPTKTRARASISAEALPLVFPDGSRHSYRDLTASLQTMPNADAAKLVAGATDPSAPGVEALSLDATVVGLPDGSEDWTPERLALTGNADLRAFPVRLLDAMASGDGTLVELLGQTLRLDADITRFPRRGGTFVFDARTEQANTGIKATVRPHPRRRDALATVLDEPMRTELTHFEYTIENKSVPLLPMFARIEKIKGKHQPASVVIEQLVAPVDGDIGLIIMNGSVDPGVVSFDLDQGLGAILKSTGQRRTGVAGDRLNPFAIAMDKGVASFSDVAIPFGEFTFRAEGKIDLIRETEDIMLYIPAGALAAEALGSTSLLVESITIPVRRQGPLGEKNKWKPDFVEGLQA
jgi:hypothetical protein